MKKIKTNILAFAFLAMGTFVGVTSCSKDKEDDGDKSDFVGTYHGSYSIIGLLEVEDTLMITKLDENRISIASTKLDTSFTATVNGNTATFDGFKASSFSAGEISLTGIDVKSGKGTLKNNTDLTVNLEGVNVEGASGEVPEILEKLFPIRNQKITTKKTFKKQ
ncbi:MAG TPA: hypothetical protein VLZ75_11435 [Chitinophagales bacterium]|nr:hypothetical protein [Chitinophagales bacterium]